MERILKISMEAELRNQSLARSLAAAYAAEFDPTVEELTEIKTAVSEAFSNAVLHAYPEGKRAAATVEMEFAAAPGSVIIIKIKDSGVGIEDIARAMEPLFTTDTGNERSGMGFTVMESFMDKIRVDSKPGKGTTVTLIKKLDMFDMTDMSDKTDVPDMADTYYGI